MNGVDARCNTATAILHALGVATNQSCVSLIQQNAINVRAGTVSGTNTPLPRRSTTTYTSMYGTATLQPGTVGLGVHTSISNRNLRYGVPGSHKPVKNKMNDDSTSTCLMMPVLDVTLWLYYLCIQCRSFNRQLRLRVVFGGSSVINLITGPCVMKATKREKT